MRDDGEIVFLMLLMAFVIHPFVLPCAGNSENEVGWIGVCCGSAVVSYLIDYTMRRDAWIPLWGFSWVRSPGDYQSTGESTVRNAFAAHTHEAGTKIGTRVLGLPPTSHSHLRLADSVNFCSTSASSIGRPLLGIPAPESSSACKTSLGLWRYCATTDRRHLFWQPTPVLRQRGA